MSDPVAPLKAILEKLKSQRVLYFAVKETQAVIAKRVWDQGVLTDGSQLGYQQDYEVWAYTPPSPKKVSGKGKPFDLWERKGEVATDQSELRSLTSRARGARAAKKKQGNKGKARSIKGGWYPTYLDYKDGQGRRDLPFELTGRLRKAFLSDAALTELSPTKVQVILKGDNAAKFKGLTNTKGDFLAPTEFEANYFKDRLNAAL